MRPLTPKTSGAIFFLTFLGLGAEVVVSFPFFFAPGWANGWPGGLSIYRVWSTWFTVTLFVMLMTCGIGAGSLISLLLCGFPSGRRSAATALATWIAFWAVLSLLACLRAFPEIYASTLEMWPHGYPGADP
jgi:hypothetical protein